MNNIHLSILGSNRFSSILNELEFNNILNLSSQSNHNNKNILVKILFVENLKVKEVKNYLLKNEPIILFLNHKDYVKKNNLSLLDFHVILDLPIEIAQTFYRTSLLLIQNSMKELLEGCFIGFIEDEYKDKPLCRLLISWK